MRSSPLRSRYLGLWLIGSAAIHAVVLAAVPVHLPSGRSEAVPVRVSLAPPKLISENQLPSAVSGPRPEESRPEPPRLRPRPPVLQDEKHAVPPAPREAPARALDKGREPVEPLDLWGEVFARDWGTETVLDVVEGMCAVQVGDATSPAGDLGGEAASGSPEGYPDGGSPTGALAPVGESLMRPRYPEESRRRGEEGEVRLRVLVALTGRVSKVAVVESSGCERLDEAARSAAGGWRFLPARRGEEAIAAWVEIPVVFELREPR